MSTFKKTIFLTNKIDNNKEFAILTLIKENNNIFGQFKIYNNDSNEYILGIKSDKNIVRQNINVINGKCAFKLNNAIDINTFTSCVLLDTRENHGTTLWGSDNNADDYKTTILGNLRNSIRKISSNQKHFSSVNNSNASDKPRELPKESNKSNNDNDSENVVDKIYSEKSMPEENYRNSDNLDSQVYSKIYSDQNNIDSEIAVSKQSASLFDSSEEEIENTISHNMLNKNGNTHNFYQLISEQLEELFDKYPTEENLEKLIDNSKWVKINRDNDNKYYVVGIIYQNDDIKYICYGVPGMYNTEQPKELIGYSQWLPTDVHSPYNQGYWVMYQDADTGENIYLN